MLRRDRRATRSTGASSADALAELDAAPGVDGYFTETFCVQSRFFQPHNGARIDAIRDAIERDYAGSSLVPGAAHEPDRGGRPGRLHDRRADGVREAVGAALVPAARAAGARAARRARARRCAADACDARARRSGRSTSRTSTRPTTSTATSRTTTCGRRWSRGTRPSTTASRASASTRATRQTKSVFNRQRAMPDALARSDRATSTPSSSCVSYNDESWVALDELSSDVRGAGGAVEVLDVRLAALRRRADRHPQPARARRSARCRTCATSSTSWSPASARGRRAGGGRGTAGIVTGPRHDSVDGVRTPTLRAATAERRLRPVRGGRADHAVVPRGRRVLDRRVRDLRRPDGRLAPPRRRSARRRSSTCTHAASRRRGRALRPSSTTSTTTCATSPTTTTRTPARRRLLRPRLPPPLTRHVALPALCRQKPAVVAGFDAKAGVRVVGTLGRSIRSRDEVVYPRCGLSPTMRS